MNPTLGRRRCDPTFRVMRITGLAMVNCKILGRRQNNQRVKYDYPSLFWLNFFEKEDREALGKWRESEKQRRPLRKIVNLGPHSKVVRGELEFHFPAF